MRFWGTFWGYTCIVQGGFLYNPSLQGSPDTCMSSITKVNDETGSLAVPRVPSGVEPLTQGTLL